MAFSYQKNFGLPTENVSHELMFSLLRNHNSKWMVAKIREIKSTAHEKDWTLVKDFKDWMRHLSKEQQKALEGKSTEELALAWADGIKKDLPLIIFVANFDETWTNPVQKPGKPKKEPKWGRWRKKDGLRLNGLSVIDLDHVVKSHDPKDVRLWWKQVSAHLDLKEIGVRMVYISASGDGVKVVFEARMEWGNLIDNQFKMAEFLGVPNLAQVLDEKCKDGSRGHFLTTEEDLIFIDEDGLYDYYNEEFDKKWTPEYRAGHSQATIDIKAIIGKSASTEKKLGTDSDKKNLGTDSTDSHGLNNNSENPAADNKSSDNPCNPCQEKNQGSEMEYCGVAISKIIEAWLDGKVPGIGERHDTMRDLAKDIRYCLENTPARIMKAFESQQWIQDLIAEGDPVETTVEGACKQKYYNSKPIRLKEALLRAGVLNTQTPGETAFNPLYQDLLNWGERIEALFDVFPLLREICHGMRVTAYPCAMFTGAAFLGTNLTRTWYFYFYQPEVERRLNYCLYVIGDPTSGKSFASNLYKYLAAPLIDSDKLGNDAINRYKKALKERTTSTKEQRKEPLKQPEVIVRVHGPRTANGVFIEDMNKAVEVVGDREMHLHLLTFDSELDSSIAAAKGGQWIDKSTMELKAFHNEEDNQQYKNADSWNGPFDVFWNYVYTGTPIALKKKVTESNFGSGLATRLACIPMPESNFQMAPLERHTHVNMERIDRMKSWAYKLDKVSGELPVWPLVEEIWHWTNDRMLLASIDQDRGDEMLLMRVGYYGISVSVPFILMRHWEEWEATKTFTIDEKDIELCLLVLDIQYKTQHYFFGRYAHNYYDNKETEVNQNKRRRTKTIIAFENLPNEFNTEDVERAFDTSRDCAYVIIGRFKKDKLIEKVGSDKFKKLSSAL